MFTYISLGGENQFESRMLSKGAEGTAQVSAEVLRYEPFIRKYAEEYGVGEYVGLIMALIQQESGGRHLEVMQSSESIGSFHLGQLLILNTPFKYGVKYFAEVRKQAKGDIYLALQSTTLEMGLWVTY